MQFTRIKICGLTRSEDVLAAMAAGADAVGLVFYAGSPRCVDIDRAAQLARLAGPFASVVALFVNPQQHEVREVVDAVQPSLLQFHGDESPGFCERFGLRYIKALHLPQPGAQAGQREAARQKLELQMQSHPNAAGFLLDTLSASGRGGTGERFDHSLWPADCDRPLVLAGGLNAGNVAAAVAACRPYAVDTSSGVEDAPGIKNHAAIENFVRAVQQART